MSPTRSIGSRLARARELAGLSRGQVVSLLGRPICHRRLTDPTEVERLRLLEEGEFQPSDREVAQLAKLYAVSAEWIQRGPRPNAPERWAGTLRKHRLSVGDQTRLVEILEMTGAAPA